MAKGYWVARMDVKDAETYDKYRAANAKPFADYGAKFLVRGGQQTPREGDERSRTVVLEFPSYADAIACYESEAYQAAKDIRLNASEGDLVIVEGYDS
ncbi:MAG: DUF1330 domain-containing protein [Sulfitobacter sp.]|jgi:uncharacterized protein (DUF1330 family)|nr:DUF1330 domain-containing protein [Sulfitobacter sp.]